jgi:hypothetical protein
VFLEKAEKAEEAEEAAERRRRRRGGGEAEAKWRRGGGKAAAGHRGPHTMMRGKNQIIVLQ